MPEFNCKARLNLILPPGFVLCQPDDAQYYPLQVFAQSLTPLQLDGTASRSNDGEIWLSIQEIWFLVKRLPPNQITQDDMTSPNAYGSVDERRDDYNLGYRLQPSHTPKLKHAQTLTSVGQHPVSEYPYYADGSLTSLLFLFCL